MSRAPGRIARLFHLADASNWALIQRDGLLSARALAERSGLSGADLEQVLRYRRTSIRPPSGALLRDQKPLPPQLLERCLEDGLTPQDWYDRLNGFVFLWANDRNLRDLAKTYRGDSSVLITLDGDALSAAHGGQAFMTRFNTGYAMRRPKPRGLGAFTPYADWVRQGWRPKEVVVEKGVPDLAALVLSAEPVGG